MLNATITVSNNNNADWIQGFQWTDTGILAPTLQSGGTGFTTLPQIVASPPTDATGSLVIGGKPALITASGIGSGAVTGLTLQDPGIGYVIGYPPIISAVGGGGSNFLAFTTVGNPVSLSGSSLTLEVRRTASDVQALITVGSASPNTGITITDAANGKFTIILPKLALAALTQGQVYVHDLVRLRPDGYTERLWTGTLTVDGGVTR
jgi:hypothetical protein